MFVPSLITLVIGVTVITTMYFGDYINLMKYEREKRVVVLRKTKRNAAESLRRVSLKNNSCCGREWGTATITRWPFKETGITGCQVHIAAFM